MAGPANDTSTCDATALVRGLASMRDATAFSFRAYSGTLTEGGEGGVCRGRGGGGGKKGGGGEIKQKQNSSLQNKRNLRLYFSQFRKSPLNSSSFFFFFLLFFFLLRKTWVPPVNTNNTRMKDFPTLMAPLPNTS